MNGAKQPFVAKIFVGKPKEYIDADQDGSYENRWKSSILKTEISGPVMLRELNLDGNLQQDLEDHGGLDKAVLGYSAEHYSLWQQELPELDLKAGAFGENFSIAGQTEKTVCLGDRFEIGEAIVEISQPRQPCSKLSWRWKTPTLTKLATTTRRLGWYFRVIQQGNVQAGDTMKLVNRPLPQWTVQEVNDVYYSKQPNMEKVHELANCTLLAKIWRVDFQEMG